jgi:hypothetical protein
MEILILLHALASVLAWWRGLLARQQRQDQRLLAHGQGHPSCSDTCHLESVAYRLGAPGARLAARQRRPRRTGEPLEAATGMNAAIKNVGKPQGERFPVGVVA